MPPQSAGSTATARLSLDVRRFPWINRLAVDYAFDFERVASFFSGNPAEPGAWSAAIARTQQYPRDHDRIAALVEAQQRRRHAPAESMDAAARLRDRRTVAIVTGQQAGLFGGPLFTLLKSFTAIKLAERVRAEHGVPAVALFWIDAEDHDWDEVKSVGILDREMNPQHVSMGSPRGAHEGPVARVQLDESVTTTLDSLEALLPQTEFTAELLESVRRAYRPGTGMATAFGAWLEAVLGPRGLVVFDASDPGAKPMVADVFARELQHAGETSRLAAEAGLALQRAGYHAQVTPHEGNVALFHLGSGRAPIRQQDDRFLWGDASATREELLAAAQDSPQLFSPNVLLRPLVQDAIFPTVCFVAGPSELAYHGQLGGVYEAFNIPRPLIQQRATATILDSNAMRFVTRHDFPLESLRAQDEAALNQLLEAQLPPTVDASLEEAARLLMEKMEAVATAVRLVDTTLEGATRSTLGRMQEDLKKLHGKVIHASKRKHETLRRQFQHAQVQAFPAGHPQERELGFIYFLNRYGPGLIDRLNDELSLDAGVHWVITI